MIGVQAREIIKNQNPFTMSTHPVIRGAGGNSHGRESCDNGRSRTFKGFSAVEEG